MVRANSGFHRPQTLVERETGCARVPGQSLFLLDHRVEAEPERRVPSHPGQRFTTHRQHSEPRLDRHYEVTLTGTSTRFRLRRCLLSG